MKTNRFLIISIVVILAFVNFLSFHDLTEIHTLKDWLVLLATILVFYHFATDLPKK